MSTPTFEPTAFIDLTREQILSVLNGGAPPTGAHPLSAAEFNRIGLALQVMSQNLAALQGTAQTASQVQAAIQAAVTTLIGGAPAALDTFVELANALGNDPNKISALATQITGKYTKPGGGIPAADLAESYSVVLPTAGATLTADTTLTANTAVQVDATTGNVTLTLPAITRVGQRVRVRRLDGTTNTVAVTGTINGVTGTVNMPFQLEIRTFVAESLTTWSVESGNTPKTALDAAYVQMGRPVIPGAFAGMKARLDAGLSAVMGVGSDSTGGGTTRWVYLFSQWLAAQYPQHSVVFRPFNQSSLLWTARTTLQTGAAGERHIAFDGTTATGLVEGTTGTPQSNIVGDLDLRARIAPNAWIGAAGAQTIISKFGAGGQRAYRFQLGSDGKLSFDWTTDGSTLQSAFGSGSVTGFTAGTAHWVRVVFKVNDSGNTTCAFYVSEDGYAWTQLGTTGSRAGTTSIASTPNQPVEIGSRSTGQSEMLAGKVYEVEVRSGADGPIVCPVRPEQWARANSNMTSAPAGAPVIDIWDGFWSGGGLANQLIPNQARMVPAVGMNTFVVSSCHNETGAGAPLWTSYDTFINYARSMNLSAGIAVTAQNPKIAPSNAQNISTHDTICTALEGYAAQRAYTLLPVRRAFAESATPITSLVQADGIHPSDASGSPLWRDVVIAVYGRR